LTTDLVLTILQYHYISARVKLEVTRGARDAEALRHGASAATSRARDGF
jgi:hypothetical protein